MVGRIDHLDNHKKIMMTTKKFKKIEKDYLKEQRRWSMLSIGQFVYIEFPRYADMEYYLCVIASIDVDNRIIGIIDFSRNEKIDTISSFRTIQELKERGIKLEEPTERELEVSNSLIKNKC